MTASRRPRPAFVAWPVPAALGLLTGILAQAAGVPLLVLTLVAVPLAVLVLQRRGRTSWALALALLLVPFAALRAEQRAALPDPFHERYGSEVTFVGVSDGRLLRLADRSGAVALRPVGRVPRGPVEVRGTLQPADPARNPGGFDERAWLRRRDAHGRLMVQEFHALRERPSFKDAVRQALTATLPAREAELVRALALGEREGAGALRDAFAHAGLAHLLALSGLHLGVIAAAVALLATPLGPRRWWLVAAAAVAFAAWIGWTPSLARAAIMTAAAATTASLGAGRPDPFTAVALAAAATLVYRPDWAFDLAFQLSYLSLLGILAFGVPVAAWAARGRSPYHPLTWVGGGVAVSASATLAALPWSLSAFGTVPLFGPLVNLPALPVASLAVPLALAAGFLGAAWASAGDAVAWLVRPLATVLAALADAGARLPSASWGEVGTLGKTAWIAALTPWAFTLRGRLPWRRAATVATAAILVVTLAGRAGEGAEAIVLDVGQGDAVLLRFPGRVAVLVDGGGSPFSDFDVGARVVVPALRALGVRALDLVVVTHADADHAEGLQAVLRAFPVATLAYGREEPGVRVWDQLEATARAAGVPLLPVRRGGRFAFADATLHVLHPDETVRPDRNDDSVALRVDWRGRPWLLLLGDVSLRVEPELAVPPLPLLLAGHHGAKDSTGAELLRAVQPEEVLISAGRGNRYGHPSEAVLRRALDAGAQVARTDRSGALVRRPAW